MFAPSDTPMPLGGKLPGHRNPSAQPANGPSDPHGGNGGFSALYEANARLSDVEYSLQRLYLHSMPRYLTIVISDRCNIDCPHCYQSKTGDNLLQDPEINSALRREFSSLYPYLSTLRLQGGEVFAIRGFRELVEDVGATTDRPLISISTNGTLIDQAWAEQIVQTPFQSITVSFDGGTESTFEKLRRGARFRRVIENVTRLQELKRSGRKPFPTLDAFFVLMRSNYREILPFLTLMKNLGIREVAFQTMLLDARNLAREPGLVNEVIQSPEEVRELYSIVQRALVEESPHFRRISWSGLHSLFKQHGLDPLFLDEENSSLYPDQSAKPHHQPPPKTEQPPPTAQIPAVPTYVGNGSKSDKPPFTPDIPEIDGASEERIQLCPNPWSMMFVVENGDVLLCFLSEPVGNLYELPLVKIWNSPRAIAKRSEMIRGRYLSSGCSKLWCDWRDGKTCITPSSESRKELLAVFKQMRDKVAIPEMEPPPPEMPRRLAAVRRLLESKQRRILELEGSLTDLWEKNGLLHDAGQSQIENLEKRNRELRAEKQRLKEQISSLRDEVESLKRSSRWPTGWLARFRH